MGKNNVVRFLEANKIKYELHHYDTEKYSAVEVAKLIDFPPNQVFKSIVVKRIVKGKIIIALIPGNSEVNLKYLAKFVNEKKVRVTTQIEAESLTKLQVGGISPLALINRGFEFIIDKSALEFPTIALSGGERGLNIECTPQDIIQLINAKTAGII